MTTRAHCTFDVTAWDETVYDDPAGRPRLARATVCKMLRGDLEGESTAERTFGHVVPGSGTGELAGLGGDVEISRTPEGVHTLTLDYALAENPAE